MALSKESGLYGGRAVREDPYRGLKVCILISANRFLRVSTLSGSPSPMSVIGISPRFQAANAASPFQAGARSLPFALSSPFGSDIWKSGVQTQSSSHHYNFSWRYTSDRQCISI